MKTLRSFALIPLLGLLTSGVGSAEPPAMGGRIVAHLNGFSSVPAIFTTATGSFTATISSSSIDYTLTFTALSAPTTVAHIHIGNVWDNGAPFAFLCGGGGKPACPAAGGTVTGTIVAADILGVAAQGVTAGDFAGAIEIIRSGSAYVNVHSTAHPGGEIRGQLRHGFGFGR